MFKQQFRQWRACAEEYGGSQRGGERGGVQGRQHGLIQAQGDFARRSRWRQQAGLVSVLELDQARAAAAQTRAQLPALKHRRL